MIFLNDFETTGLPKDGNPDFLIQPGIVQIGTVILDSDLKEIASYKTYINPEVPDSRWEAGAIKVHKITPDMVQTAPTFFAAFDDFAALAEGCDTWAGYNTKFDKDILWFQLLRYGFERSFPWPRKDLDVMKLASDRLSIEGKRGNKRPKLIEIYEHLFGESFEAHDALEDIRATARVLRELKI